MNKDLVHLAGIACCADRDTATTRAVAVDRRATGSLASANTTRSTDTLRAPRPAVAGYHSADGASYRAVRRLPGTITGKNGVRHLAGTVFTYASI